MAYIRNDSLYVYQKAGVRVYKVSEVVDLIKQRIDKDPEFKNIFVIGEISDPHTSHNGHAFFVIKDNSNLLKCVIFASTYRRLGINIESNNGRECIIQGHISIYKSEIKVIVESITFLGRGDLFEKFMALREKLADEGLFNIERKRALPEYPKVIGVVTSLEGAAIKDFIKNLRIRYPIATIVVAPTLVQGQQASDCIVKAIKNLNAYGKIDIIVVTRGGGSIEDLWCFNEEAVVRAIASSRVPVITAIGHERDVTLSDLASDKMVPTPTKAAEIIGRSIDEIKRELKHTVHRIHVAMERIVDHLSGKYNMYMSFGFDKIVIGYIERLYMDIMHMNERIEVNYRHIQDNIHHLIEMYSERIDALNPRNVLKRGFARVERVRDGKVVATIMDVDVGDDINVILHDGDLIAKVKNKKKDGDI